MMEGVRRRLPEVFLIPEETESDLLREVRDWRNSIRTIIPNINLESVRIDSCVNGYGMSCLLEIYLLNVMI